jgi:hypothetical protein
LRKLHFNAAFVVIVISLVLAGCKPNVPDEITSQCRAEAVRVGYGRCDVQMGRQNSFGVWTVKMECTLGGTSQCLVNSGGPSVFPWGRNSDTLYWQ